MTDRYAHYVEAREPKYPIARPYTLWRRSAAGWEHWSTVDWVWRGLDDEVSRAPAPDGMVLVTAADAEALTRDRSKWFRFWAVHSDPWPQGPVTAPVTVVRRRAGSEPPKDQSYNSERGWILTSVLRQHESGRASHLPLLRPIDVAEAEAILRRRFGVTDATGP